MKNTSFKTKLKSLLNEKMMFTCALNISEDSMSAKDPEKVVEIIER